MTSCEKFVFVSHLRKPKIRNKARDFPKPITSQTLLTHFPHFCPPQDDSHFRGDIIRLALPPPPKFQLDPDWIPYDGVGGPFAKGVFIR